MKMTTPQVSKLIGSVLNVAFISDKKISELPFKQSAETKARIDQLKEDVGSVEGFDIANLIAAAIYGIETVGQDFDTVVIATLHGVLDLRQYGVSFAQILVENASDGADYAFKLIQENIAELEEERNAGCHHNVS